MNWATAILSRASAGLVRCCACAAALAVAAAGGCGAAQTLPLAAALQAESPTVRTRACRRAAEAEDPTVIPLLVERLEDTDPGVRMFAIGALRRMTKQSFGYRYFDDEVTRLRAVRQWRDWLARRNHSGTGG